MSIENATTEQLWATDANGNVVRVVGGYSIRHCGGEATIWYLENHERGELMGINITFYDGDAPPSSDGLIYVSDLLDRRHPVTDVLLKHAPGLALLLAAELALYHEVPDFQYKALMRLTARVAYRIATLADLKLLA